MKIIKAVQINYQLFTFLKNHNVEKTKESIGKQ